MVTFDSLLQVNHYVSDAYSVRTVSVLCILGILLVFSIAVYRFIQCFSSKLHRSQTSVLVIDHEGIEYGGLFMETDEGELLIEVNGIYLYVLPDGACLSSSTYVSWKRMSHTPLA
jgi:hypothetical protein